MKNLDCNQIKILINLEIIGEEKLYIFFLKIFKKKKICNLVKLLGTITASKPNFYYIVYDMIWTNLVPLEFGHTSNNCEVSINILLWYDMIWTNLGPLEFGHTSNNCEVSINISLGLMHRCIEPNLCQKNLIP